VFSVQDVAPDVALKKLGHQAVHGSSGGAHHLQNFGAIALFVQDSHQSFYLPPDALGPEQEILLVVDCVAHSFVVTSELYHTGYGSRHEQKLFITITVADFPQAMFFEPLLLDAGIERRKNNEQ
jgi:hypothetical protein